VVRYNYVPKPTAEDMLGSSARRAQRLNTALGLVKVRKVWKAGALVFAIVFAAILALSNSGGTSRKIAASYLACADAVPGKTVHDLRQAYGPMAVAFSDKRGGTLVGYKRFFGAHWLCAVATDAGGHILGAVRLRGER